jgi:hypothetical protein
MNHHFCSSDTSYSGPSHQDSSSKDLLVFNETRGIEILAATRNRTTGQFNGTVFQMLQQLIAMCEVISHRQLNDLKKEAKNMFNDPQTLLMLLLSMPKTLLSLVT